jgi:hypothetical protein
MKTAVSLGLALVAFSSAHAQIFRSEAVKGAVLGGIAGGVIGHNSGDNNGWRGAAIGATAGLLIGQAIGDSRADRDYRRHGHHGGYVYRSAPAVHVGIGYHHGGYWGGHRYHGYRHHGTRWHVGFGPSFGYYRGYGFGYPHAGYGDYVYRPSYPVVVAQPQPVVVQQAPVPQPAPAPQQVTIINNYYNNASPMSGANGLFGR